MKMYKEYSCVGGYVTENEHRLLIVNDILKSHSKIIDFILKHIKDLTPNKLYSDIFGNIYFSTPFNIKNV